jgi:hypothetical protein
LRTHSTELNTACSLVSINRANVRFSCPPRWSISLPRQMTELAKIPNFREKSSDIRLAAVSHNKESRFPVLGKMPTENSP